MNELLKLAKQMMNLSWRWRYELGIAEVTAARPDPVLAGADFSGKLMLSPHARHEEEVQLGNEAGGDWKILKQCYPAVQCFHIVSNFSHV